MNLHFICRGNVLRSLIAESYVKSLNLNKVAVISSGTNVDWANITEREYFSNTVNLLDRHGIKSYVKDHAEQLTVTRATTSDIIVCMNQRVIDEASAIIDLPATVLNWNIVDIGEGSRVEDKYLEQYEEEIYTEITEKVDALVTHHNLR